MGTAKKRCLGTARVHGGTSAPKQGIQQQTRSDREEKDEAAKEAWPDQSGQQKPESHHITPCIRYREPSIDVRRQFLMCLQLRYTEFRIAVPRI